MCQSLFLCFLFVPNSKKVLRIIAQVLEVKGDDKFSKMVEELAVERDGMSLVYMHHNDALRSGTSYQNEARLSLRDNLKVSYRNSSTVAPW